MSQQSFTVVLFTAFVMSLPGCDSQTEESSQSETPGAALAGVEFTVSVPKGFNLVESWRPFADEWESRSGASVVLSEDTTLGLRLFPITELPTHYIEDQLASIEPDLINESGDDLWTDLAGGLRNIVRRRKLAVAIPLSSPTLVCYYRADLLEAAKRKAPETWDEYQNLIKTIDSWAPGFVAVEPWTEEFRSTLFLAKAASYSRFPGNLSLCFDLSTHEPLINEPGFVTALEDCAKTLKALPANVLELSPYDCAELVKTGKAAMAIGIETAGPFETVGERDDSVRIEFTQLPGRKSVYNRGLKEWSTTPDGNVNRPGLTAFVGYCIGFSKEMSESQQQAAINFIAELTNEELVSSQLPSEMRSVCRLYHEAVATEQWYGQSLQGDESRNYSRTVFDCLRANDVIPELPLFGRDQFRETLATAVTNVMTNGAQPDAELNRVAESWKALAKSLGESKVQNSYRTSFGRSAR